MTHPTLDEPRIKAILAQPYGRFSDAEFARRRRALVEVMERNGCDAIIVCGEERTGTGVVWLTGWPTRWGEGTRRGARAPRRQAGRRRRSPVMGKAAPARCDRRACRPQ
jgi:hypothetical protein